MLVAQCLTKFGHICYTGLAVIINIAEAKAQLSALAARAADGEEIIRSRNGKPIARIVPLESVVPAAPGRGFGIGRGDFVVPETFDSPLPDVVLDAFEAGDLRPE
jgi:prevent-host-death family protein